jgi:hypothetical protein
MSDTSLAGEPPAERECCGNCGCWHKSFGVGLCRRYPPTEHAFKIGDDHGHDTETRMYYSFPSTAEDNWCGEWRKAR